MVSVVEPTDSIGEPQGSSQHLVRTPEIKRVGRSNTSVKQCTYGTAAAANHSTWVTWGDT